MFTMLKDTITSKTSKNRSKYTLALCYSHLTSLKLQATRLYLIAFFKNKASEGKVNKTYWWIIQFTSHIQNTTAPTKSTPLNKIDSLNQQGQSI